MFDNVRSINCRQLDPSTFAKLTQAEEAKGSSRAPEAPPVRIDLNIESNPEILVSIYSHRSGDTPLYHGKLLDAVEVFPQRDLFQRSGLDNLHFKFFDLKNLRVCSQMQDGGATYWQPGKAIRIEFLREREVDPDIGTPIGHRVRLE